MDMNAYLIEWLAKERMGEVQAAMLRARIAESARRRPSLRVVLGLALIGLGRRLQGRRRASADALTA
jgi:hypothetical protein